MLCQYLRVWNILRGIVLEPLRVDRFIWSWNADGAYSASSAYRAFFAGSASLPGAKELWKTKAPARVKFFFWLAVHQRLWTADRRKRHGLQPHDTCALCGQEAETCDQFLAGCVLARELWFAVPAPLGVSVLVPVPDSRLIDWWLRSRLALLGDLRPAFDCLVMLVAWILWKERNARTFNQEICNVQELLSKLLREAQDWMAAGFVSLSVLPQLLSHLNTAL